MKDHTNSMHLNQKRFKCSECGFKSYFMHYIKNHIATNHTDNECKIEKIICSQCGSGTKHDQCNEDEEEGQKPSKVAKIDGSDEKKCTKCSFVTQKGFYLKRHLQLSHGQDSDPSKIIHCESCEFETLRTKSLVDHTNAQHLNQKRFSCSECGFKSYYDQHVKTHIKSKHEFQRRVTSLKLHEGPKPPKVSKIDGSEKKCTECSFVTQKGFYLKRHLQLSHGEDSDPTKIIHCESCEFETAKTKSLVDHTNAQHLNQKRYNCSKCGFKSYYDQHVQSHIATNHPKSESEVERISCNECRFNREHVQCIEDHLESKKQNFACNYCDVKFMTNQEVIVIHMKSFHPEQKLFHCNNCSYRCNWLYNLRNHKKAKHKSEVTSKDESLEATFSGIIGLFMKHVETTSRDRI